ncbi:MAG: hypothetical protein AAFO58_06280 [Pseudomonadota bacterium]
MRWALALSLAATPVLADLSDRQQAAYDVILPALETSLEEQGGDALLPMAPLLATCIVETAKRREVGDLGDGEMGEDDVALMNEIMLRPKVQGCVAKAANG